MKCEGAMSSLRQFFTINTHTIPLKIACFLAGGVIGSHVAFLNVFFVSVGLSKFKAGIITGLTYAPPIIAGPVWGYLADFTGRRRLILVVLCIGAVVPLFSTPWVARAVYPASQYKCQNNTAVANNMNGNATHEPFIACSSGKSGISGNIAECETLRTEALDSLFWILLAIMLVASVFLVPLQPHIDAIVMSVVKSGKTGGASYGAQRIFGCLGISLVNYLAGKAAVYYQVTDISPYSAAFFVLLPCSILLIPVGSYLIGRLNQNVTTHAHEEDVEKPVTEIAEKSQFNQVVNLCCSFDVIVFLTTVLIVGLANGVFLNFSFLYVTEAMGKSNSEMTYVVVTSTISEAVMFPFTAKLIKLLRGTTTSIIVGSLAHFVRFLIMSRDIPFELFVALQTLSSLGFALSFAAMMEHVHHISPEPIRVTMSTIMTTLFFIVSNFVANIGGAKIYELHGGKTLFLGQALLCGIWAAIMVIYYGSKRFQRRYLRNKGDTTLALSPEDEIKQDL